MKFTRVISPAALFLLLGTGASVYGQHEEHGQEGKPQSKAQPQQRQPQQHAQQQQQQRAQPPKQQAQPQQRAQQPKPQAQPQQHQQQPQQRAQQGQPGGRQTNYAPPQRTRQQAQTWQQQSSWRQDGAWQGHASWQENRSSNWQHDHRNWEQRGGYGGYYIPQDSFSLHFGVGNWFRIQSQPIIVGGYPRFQYGGYTFMMVDPWPSDWAEDWYSADDVYVGYDNGYYLYNRAYPGEAIAITVVL